VERRKKLCSAALEEIVAERGLAMDDAERLFLFDLVQATLERHRDKVYRRIVCVGCGKRRMDMAQYIVHDALWKQAGFKGRDFACLGCLSGRLGRIIQLEDFPGHVPLNRHIEEIVLNVQ
jgi:hypothetical protein